MAIDIVREIGGEENVKSLAHCMTRLRFIVKDEKKVNLEALKKHLLSEAGALNVYSSDMLVFEDGVFKPFEIMFNGDNDTVIPIDKDNFDTPLDIKAMQDRIWVRWMDPKELEPLTDEEVAEYRKSIGK